MCYPTKYRFLYLSNLRHFPAIFISACIQSTEPLCLLELLGNFVCSYKLARLFMFLTCVSVKALIFNIAKTFINIFQVVTNVVMSLPFFQNNLQRSSVPN